MDSQRYALKLFVKPPCEVPEKDIILFFHRLIQEAALGETWIDVTDYSHVPDGPGVMLISHEAHYSMDSAGGRLGLKCATKRGASGDAIARLRRVAKKTLGICALIEAHEIFAGRLRFDTSHALFSIEDRLAAPNTTATFEAMTPVLIDLLSPVWGTPTTIARAGSAKECFQVTLGIVSAAASAPSVTELLSRLG